jgi:lysyl-tRNA synthetase class 2
MSKCIDDCSLSFSLYFILNGLCWHFHVQEKEHGDIEAQPPDEDYCQDLEIGLPPTTGWGMGIDRLCMLLTGARHMRDVIPFPMQRR